MLRVSPARSKHLPVDCPVQYISLPQRYSSVEQVLLVSEFSASTQQLFLPDKQPAANHSAAFTEGMERKKEWIRTDWSLDWTTEDLGILNLGDINLLACC